MSAAYLPALERALQRFQGVLPQLYLTGMATDFAHHEALLRQTLPMPIQALNPFVDMHGRKGLPLNELNAIRAEWWISCGLALRGAR